MPAPVPQTPEPPGAGSETLADGVASSVAGQLRLRRRETVARSPPTSHSIESLPRSRKEEKALQKLRSKSTACGIEDESRGTLAENLPALPWQTSGAECAACSR